MVKATRNLSLGLALAALVVLVTAGAALAQLPQTAPTVTVALDATTLDLGAGNTTEVTATVTNAGSLDGTVALTVETLDGWTLAVDPSTPITLAAGQSAPVTLTLTAPAAGVGTASGPVALLATITDAAGRSGNAEGLLTVTRVDPPAPPPPPPPYGLYAAIAGSALALVAATGVVLLRRRNARLAAERAAAEEARRKAEHEAYLARETGIGISLVDGPLKFGNRREVVFRVAIENQTQRERNALIGVADLPEGWTAASAIPKATLRPGERMVVTFYVNPGDAVPTGAKTTLVFAAKPEEARELDERVSVEVTAPEPRVPELGDKSVVIPREPIAPRPSLRL